MTTTVAPPTELKQSWFSTLVDRLQVYGLDRLTAMQAANEARPVHEAAYAAGLAAGEGTERVVALLDKVAEHHCARRSGDPTYDTARAVLTDMVADLKSRLAA